jgi:chromosome segregation ATPase
MSKDKFLFPYKVEDNNMKKYCDAIKEIKALKKENAELKRKLLTANEEKKIESDLKDNWQQCYNEVRAELDTAERIIEDLEDENDDLVDEIVDLEDLYEVSNEVAVGQLEGLNRRLRELEGAVNLILG